ncbi:hypothetical protein ABW21_db0206096 [Orbilia brochopaga]|nr:hypothetical protein ABW21_db0206096 [Drechslerella brochopaga]
MIRPALSRSLQRSQPLLRSATSSVRPAVFSPRPCLHAQRSLFTSTRPSTGSRFRAFVGRFGLAVAVVYWYNTTTLFAEEPAEKQPFISRAPPVEPIPEERFATIDEVMAERKAKAASQDISSESTAIATDKLPEARSPESLEEEAGQQGAFNEETGEINWDCPCLGGMAHGPCGEEFREAFSCFVFSKEEPKGVDCIEKFKGMQTCFQKFPEIYGEPPSDDEDDEEIDRKLAELDAENSSPEHLSASSAANPSSSLPHATPQNKGTEEYTHPAPVDNADPKAGTLGHSAPGEKGIGGGSHEGPVDTDASTTGIVRPAPSSSGLEGIAGHGAPGVKGVDNPSGPLV